MAATFVLKCIFSHSNESLDSLLKVPACHLLLKVWCQMRFLPWWWCVPGFSRQKHWSGLPFPSPMHESEKWKRSRSVMPDSLRPHGLQPTRLLHPWDFPGKSTGVGCHRLPRLNGLPVPKCGTPGFALSAWYLIYFSVSLALLAFCPLRTRSSLWSSLCLIHINPQWLS